MARWEESDDQQVALQSHHRQSFFLTPYEINFSRRSLYQADYPKTNWVPRARWVVDGNTWTASGVTAGADMGYAFLTHLVGKEFAEMVRGIVELSVHKEDDDEFADVYGLV